MSTLETNLIKRVNISSAAAPTAVVKSRAYRGTSTVDPDQDGFTLYDLALIKQDLINHFHISQGEKLENPTYGTIIWDLVYEPLTEEVKTAIAENVTTIVNSDPRVAVNDITLDSYETGIQVTCDLTYLPYNISETLQLQFDQSAGLIS